MESDYKKIAAQLRKPEGKEGVETGNLMNDGNKLINLYTIENLPLKANDSVMEVGMGNGYFVKDLFKKEPTITYCGCDFSEIMVDESLKNNPELIHAKKAEFNLASVTALPYQNEFFDVLFTVNTIYFWPDMDKAFNEIRRVLKPGGKLVLSLRPKSVMKDYPFVKYGFQMFENDELQNILQLNGFSDIVFFEIDEPSTQEFTEEILEIKTLIVSAKKA